jgi:hypothetical protein
MLTSVFASTRWLRVGPNANDKGLNAQMKAAAPMHRVLNLRRWQAW